jgi:uncharacterized protein (TIGR00255 family)
VDIYIGIDSSKADDIIIRLNDALLAAYIKALKRMKEDYGVAGEAAVSDYLRIGDIFLTEKKEIDSEAFTADLAAVAEEALASFNLMRAKEGEKLAADIFLKLDEIERLRGLIAERYPAAAAEYREKLVRRMNEILAGANIDEARILTEAALFADKTAVDEELVRLESHIEQLRGLLGAGNGSGVGRKLDFIVQELNREANTIGSKCSDLEITRLVVDMKSEIEKIREQAQNIE